MSSSSITLPRRDPGVSADDRRAAAPAARDQAASLRHRVRRAPPHAPRHEEPLARGVSRRRFQPSLHRGRPGDLPDGEALAGCAAAERSRRGRRGPLQGHPDDQDHGAAVELHLAHRREGDPPRSVQADQGRILHGGDTPAFGLPWQSVHHRGGIGLRKGLDQTTAEAGRARGPACRGRGPSGRRRARARHSLRQPRAAALPAVRLRDVQGRRSRPPGGTTAWPSPGALSPPGPW